ncbi:MAG: DUF4352 domain-containing protein [Lactobacillus sp.]|jgi:hypothetical protein|nr:DUF4352 domain-containing protein [Lactobacillus sp.]MCI2032101.1 DUF4352 domain-containing protein [Lactobacillus sp.]
MAKKQIKGEDGKTYTVKEAKAWYKRWWIWAIVVVVLIFIVPALVGGGGSSDDSSSSTKTAKTAKGSSTKKEASSSSSAAKTIKFDNGTRDIVSEATYPVSYSDNSWAGTTVSIDKARVIQVKPFKDDGDSKTYEGIVEVHFTVKATRDISIYPSQATLITSDGQQTDADGYDTDNFDGDLGKGVTKDGTVRFELPKLTDAKSIKTLRLKWSGNYDTDDVDDDGAYKDYDATITLQN